MPRRSLLKFRNPDSTQDLNDRFKDLFNKGFFSGGTITAVPGVLKVDLAPFATAGSDGMFVREDSETTRLEVVANFKNYIVIRQEYIPNADPTVSVESLTEPEFVNNGPAGFKGADNPTLIVFGVVNVPSGATATSQSMIETFESDIVDNLGRSQFRGLLEDEIDLPGAAFNANRAGDFYIITDGTGDFPSFFVWNGVSWINITNTQVILDLLDSHVQNQNTDQKHLSDEQAKAAAGSFGAPSDSNRYVTQTDPRVLTNDEADANVGNGLPLEDFLPSASNQWVSSSKVFAVPTEVVVDSGTPGPTQTLNTTIIELPPLLGGYFVGSGTEALTGTSHQWFNVYAEDTAGDEEYINDDFNEVRVLAVSSGNTNDLGGTHTPVNPQTDTDTLGFYVNPSRSLYLTLSHNITSPCRIGYGKRGSLGTLLPQLLMNRGPKGGQIDTRLLRLLLGTPNAQFEDTSIFDGSVAPGSVVAFNSVTATFVNADPNAGLTPVGIRGNYNNLIMEGLFTASSNLFAVDFLYADKANPGSLTNIPNEWFIGRAISATQLLVNMNQIPLLPSGEVIAPVAFDASLFQNTVQAGTPVCWFTANLQFEAADSNDPDRLPLGIRGNNNNVIQSGKYQALTGTPFTSGTRYYAGADAFAGTLVTTENDWFVGIGIDDVTLLINANGVPIPANWEEEHHSDSGLHKFKFGGFPERDLITNPASGMIFIHSDDDPPRIEFYNGSTWTEATSSFVTPIPSGSKMLFIQDSVPTGWTLDTSVNDAVIRVVDSAASGGLTAGSWTITGFQADDHALVENEMPAHRHHGYGEIFNTWPFGHVGSNNMGSGDTDFDNHFYNTSTTGGGASPSDPPGDGLPHGHTVSNDGTWRPSYINAIICIKD